MPVKREFGYSFTRVCISSTNCSMNSLISTEHAVAMQMGSSEYRTVLSSGHLDGIDFAPARNTRNVERFRTLLIGGNPNVSVHDVDA